MSAICSFSGDSVYALTLVDAAAKGSQGAKTIEQFRRVREHVRFLANIKQRNSALTISEGRRLGTVRDASVKEDEGRKRAPFNNLGDGRCLDNSHDAGTTSDGHPLHVRLRGEGETHVRGSFVAVASGGLLVLVRGCRVGRADRLMVLRTRLRGSAQKNGSNKSGEEGVVGNSHASLRQRSHVRC